MSLNKEQIDLLLQPLSSARVRQLQGNSHLEAWDVRRWLLRVFGWGGWDFTVKSCDLVSERSVWNDKEPLKGRHTVVYRVLGTLTIKDPEGRVLAVFEDGAMGDGINQPSLMAAHDFALKSALSQALKRCAVNVGDLGGLGLYGGIVDKAVVGRSAAHPDSAIHEAQESVSSGEMDIPEPAAAPTTAPVPSSSAVVPAAVEGSPVVLSPDTTGDSQDVERDVAALQERIIAATQMKKVQAYAELGRLGAEIARLRLSNAATTDAEGVAQSLGVFHDGALQYVTKRELKS